tara:strand:- start:775 stop:1608 length:834 start_codon:yes stop_codon:yes gene_type:complete
MAEILTLENQTESEVMSDAGELTSDEQDSLAVGEKLVEAQENLLAGKYKDAEELEKAYINLQKKLGEDGKEEKEAPQAETEQEEVLPEEPEEQPQESSPATELITSASEEFAESGALTPETLEKFNSMSSKDLVEAYMAIQANTPQDDTSSAEPVDISEATVNEVKNFAGGDKAYEQMVNWASNNLDQKSIDAFDTIIGSGSLDAIKLAVNGLKAQYQEANGYEGNMITGKPPTNTKDVYRSQAELVKAMSDRRYDNDPAYRQDVIEKLERSDNLTF